MTKNEWALWAVREIVSRRHELEELLQEEWPEFQGRLSEALAQLAAAETTAKIEERLGEVLFVAWETPAWPIFQEIIQAAREEGWLGDGGSKGAAPEGLPGGEPLAGDFRELVYEALDALEPMEMAVGPSRPEGRYLSAGFAAGEQRLSPDDALRLGGDPYALLVNVSPAFWGPGEVGPAVPERYLDEAFATEAVLALDVLVRSPTIGVSPATQPIKLPADPAEASTMARFELSLARVGRQTLYVDLFFRGHLLQSRLLAVDVLPPPGLELTDEERRALGMPPGQPPQDGYVLFSRDTALDAGTLGDLGDAPRLLTILIQRDEQQRFLLTFADNSGAELHVQQSELTPQSLAPLLETLRAALQTLMHGYKGKVGGSQSFLRQKLAPVAIAGWRFYRKILPELADQGAIELGALLVRRALAPGAIIQVAPLTAQVSVPWEALYERPIDEDVSRLRLCGTWQSGDPAQCNHGDDATVLCPFGFWGFRYIVEQLPGRRRQPRERPASGALPTVVRNGAPTRLPAVVYPGFNLWEAHKSRLRALAPDDRLDLESLESFRAIKTFMGAADSRPAIVYFYTHGGQDEQGAPFVRVARDERIGELTLAGWGLDWKETQPLVIFNACGSADYRPESFENLIQFMVERGAAGVVAAQCDLREMLVDAFSLRFLPRFLCQEPAGTALLAARRSLLLDHLDPRGLAYSLFAAAEVRLAQPVLQETDCREVDEDGDG